MFNFRQLIIHFISKYIKIGTIITVNISLNTSDKQYPLRLPGQSPGFVIEEAIGHIFDNEFNNWITSPEALGLLGPNITYVPGNIHQSFGSTFDFVFNFKDNQLKKELQFRLDSKAEKKNHNIRSTKKQSNNKNNPNAYIIYVKYSFLKTDNSGNLIKAENKDVSNMLSIDNLIVTSFKKAYDIKLLRDSKQIIEIENPLNESLKISKCNVNKNKVDIILSKRQKTLNETIQYLNSPEVLLEAKKNIQLKKFIEENFDKKGEYIYPKYGNPKCSFHPEYDKGLLRFLAKHGISKIMSAFGNNVPSLGYSISEEKWYGWSHRAIYGFKVGDKIKKGTCGYEKMKEKNLLNIKDLNQAKEVAKIFADSIA